MGELRIDRAADMPPSEAAEALSSAPEDQWFERKSGRVSPRDLAVPLVALANAEGGHVVAGIHDGTIEGVARERINALRQVAADFTNPMVSTHIQEIPVDEDRSLLLIRVPPSNQVHETQKGDCFLRIGDESRRLTYSQRRELEYDRTPAPFDGTSVDAHIKDLDQDRLEEYRSTIGAASPAAALEARDLLTRGGALTVAGWLLFAPRPQQLFPSAHVRILHYSSTDRGTGASMSLTRGRDIRCEGSLPEQIAEAAELIDQWMPAVEALSSRGRFEARPLIPRDVWLEGLVNAVIHRSYSIAGDHIRVEIFPNRIEVESPGRFPGLADPSAPLSIARYARNPRVVRVCSEIGISRELGEGIKRIFEEMRSAGLTDPIYTQTSSSVRLTLTAADAIPESIRGDLPKSALMILDTLRREATPMGSGQIASLTGVARPTANRHLQALRDKGLIIWEGKSARDPRASWRLP